MQKIKANLPALLKDSRARALAIAGTALLIALIVALCISINMRARIQSDYAAARSQVGEALYSNLYMLMQTFDMTSVPTADIRNSVLPQMKEYFIASTTLNDLLTRAYGQRYRVMDESVIVALKNAFAAYEQALNEGASTDLARTDMQSCMTMVRELLVTRFSDGLLKVAR